MELTNEQYAIINSTGDIKINAVAGSGKTTTIIEYAKTRPTNSKILYLAFNKSVKIEAEKKFASKGLSNVKVETAHSLAYKHIVLAQKYKVRSQGYKTHEIKELLGIEGGSEKHSEYIVANHINRFISYFCNSDKQKVQELNYLDVVHDNKAKAFVTTYYDYIATQTRLLLSKMDKGEIDITHDFYLKKFQLSNPSLNYDYILFDEGQDASPAMLDVFLNQKATKVIVGDIYQQIYGWRFAINSLEKTNFKTFQLTTSFRFSQEIANLATAILDWKKHLGEHNTVTISGLGNSKDYKSKAVLARTNLGLLLKAIEYVTEKEDIKQIYFEGNINSYTYAEDGASLYDVLNLHAEKKHLIKDKLIKTMVNVDELKEYIEKTDDLQLGMMVEIVKEYGNKIPDIIKAIKDKHVGDIDKDKAQMVFSTIHRCKGMEYDSIQLVNDFLSEEKLKDLISGAKGKDLNIERLNEEINLLYVAVTRTKNSIHIPEILVPDYISSSSKIHKLKVIKVEEVEEMEIISSNRQIKDLTTKGQSYTFETIREKHKDAYKPWSKEQDDELEIMYCEGISTKDLAKHFGRTRGAITSRIKKLELEEKYN